MWRFHLSSQPVIDHLCKWSRPIDSELYGNATRIHWGGSNKLSSGFEQKFGQLIVVLMHSQLNRLVISNTKLAIRQDVLHLRKLPVESRARTPLSDLWKIAMISSWDIAHPSEAFISLLLWCPHFPRSLWIAASFGCDHIRSSTTRMRTYSFRLAEMKKQPPDDLLVAINGEGAQFGSRTWSRFWQQTETDRIGQ